MNEFFHADIFFFVTTIAVIFVAAALTTLLIYIVLIARDVRRMTRRVREEGDAFMDNIATLRERVMEDRSKVYHLLTLGLGMAQRMWESRSSGRRNSNSSSSRSKSSTSSRSRSSRSSSSS